MKTSLQVKQAQEAVRVRYESEEHKLTTCLRVASEAEKHKRSPFVAVFELCEVLSWDSTPILYRLPLELEAPIPETVSGMEAVTS
jgi:hypothetical protein